MAKRAPRKFEAFVMHAHHDTSATYSDLFERLRRLRPEARVHRYTDELVVGFPIVSRESDGYFIQSVLGSPESALVLNTQTGNTRENILAKTELLSHATHLLVSPPKRRAAVEYSHRGAKALMLAESIEGVLRGQYPDLRDIGFSFAPVIRENFIAEINAFERIREADIRVTRPNASWTDHYTELSELAEESGGDKVGVSVKAGRSATLKKNAGIVKVIKDVVRDKEPYLDDATVKGVRQNETAETAVHAKKHVQHGRAIVNTDEAGVPILSDIRSKLSQFLSTVLG
jgi:hypothetical protein